MQKWKEKKVSTEGATGQMLWCAEICISIFRNEFLTLIWSTGCLERTFMFKFLPGRSKKNNLMRNYPIHFHLNFWLAAGFCPSVIRIFFPSWSFSLFLCGVARWLFDSGRKSKWITDVIKMSRLANWTTVHVMSCIWWTLYSLWADLQDRGLIINKTCLN